MKIKLVNVYKAVKIILVLCLVAQSCLTLCDPMDCSLPGSSVHGDSPGKNTGVGYQFLLQGIFQTQDLRQVISLGLSFLIGLSVIVKITASILRVYYVSLLRYYYFPQYTEDTRDMYCYKR